MNSNAVTSLTTFLALGVGNCWGTLATENPVRKSKEGSVNSLPRKLEALGNANQAVSYANNLAVLAPGPDGQGRSFYISYYRTEGRAEILAFDPATKTLRRYASESLGLYGMLRARDGTIYAGGINPGCLYALRPGSTKLETVGRPPGVSYIWDLVEGADGKVYGACYPDAILAVHDPVAKTCTIRTTFSNSKEFPAHRKYLRFLSAAPDGRLWCGVGCPSLLYLFDPKTGQKNQVLPSDCPKAIFAWNEIFGDEAYYATMMTPGTTPTLLVYDVRTAKIVQRLEQDVGSPIPGDHLKGCYFYKREALELTRYRPETGKLETILKGVDLGFCKWVEEDRYVHGMVDQNYCRYDLHKKEFTFRERLTPPSQQGMLVWSMCAGPDGDIYGGVYINQHLWKVEAQTGKIVELGEHRLGAGQIDRIASGGGKVWCGSYCFADLAAYDPKQPWNLIPGDTQNPRHFGSVPYSQVRVRCVLYGPDGKVYMSSYPDYASSGESVLSVFDPATRKFSVPGLPVPNVMAAGTYCIFGGNETLFYAYDCRKKEIVHRQARAVSALAGLPDGRILCSGSGKLAIFEPEKAGFTLEKESGLQGQATALAVGKDGSAYGIHDGGVFHINVDDLSTEFLQQPGGKFLALDRFGNLYFAREAKLFRLVR